MQFYRRNAAVGSGTCISQRTKSGVFGIILRMRRQLTHFRALRRTSAMGKLSTHSKNLTSPPPEKSSLCSDFSTSPQGGGKGMARVPMPRVARRPLRPATSCGLRRTLPPPPPTLKLRWAGRRQMQPCYDRIMVRFQSDVVLPFTLPLREGRKIQAKRRIFRGGVRASTRSLCSRPPTEKLLRNFSAPPQGGSEEMSNPPFRLRLRLRRTSKGRVGS